MKNLVATLKIAGKGNPLNWSKHTIESQEKYAARIGADFLLWEKPCREGGTRIMTADLTKYSIMEHFVNSDYDNLLFLDLDIRVTKTAPDFFEVFFNPEGIKDDIVAVRDVTWCWRYEVFDEWLTNFDIPLRIKTYFNFGVWGMSKEACKKFTTKMNGMFDYRHPSQSYEFNRVLEDPGQQYFNLVLNEIPDQIMEIPNNWNAPSRHHTIVKKETHHFIHYIKAKKFIGTKKDKYI